MADFFDGYSNIESLTARINALRQAQESGATAPAASSQPLDPDTFILETQKNFNQMLNSLVTPIDRENSSGSADPFSFLTNSTQTSLLQQIEDLKKAQNTPPKKSNDSERKEN
ncbi:hypothetical protein A2625_02995 [candidate division WOR-1 bacterium RIFCSPHIGHO2_01_FULL_53_15]|uniref:Uncharacterized protein n=1 Tax=candidate division WOR-1 bacterium RIFCSPHIGHO2_01_FULL_53_15 TaxID=1802564 RepID=A0A1F4Q314_UNCSA|nr:MAG: hypothetical protein A2625_02995 [candidate division WOR-1 bacterium RIFCSPHIGHO2_01_FULL_53_15]OGC10392.1 MAG: hypothetical protein A3D23_07680 [candidate division WOR-1 bacterium RIFCSPHIGHO2_02_FULL_53_26]